MPDDPLGVYGGSSGGGDSDPLGVARSSPVHADPLGVRHGSKPPLMQRHETDNPIVAALSRLTKTGKALFANPEIQNFVGQQSVPDFSHPIGDTGPGLAHAGDVLLHGNTQDEEDADRASIRRGAGIEGIYGSLPHPAQGVVDFGIDSAFDPTTFIPGSAYARGARAVASGTKFAARPLITLAAKHAPQGARDAVDLARSGANAVRDQFMWGGDAHRSLTPEQYRDAALASNRQGAREHELARRLEERRAQIFDHLDEGERHEAYRALNGETQPTSAKVALAVSQGRKLLRDAGYIQADKGGRARLAAGTGRAGNARFAKPDIAASSSIPEGIPVTRWEREGSTGLGSQLRGGRHFMVGHDDAFYKGGENAGNEGGTKLVKGYANPKNPLHIDLNPQNVFHATSSSGAEVIRQLGDQKMNGLVRLALNGNDGAKRILLEKAGLPSDEIEQVIARTGDYGAVDRAGAELARKAGHDAIITRPGNGRDEIVMLDHKFNPSNPAADFESMVPDDVSQVTNRTKPKLKLKGAALPEYQLPDELKEFAAPAEQGVLGAGNIREHYLPGVKSSPTVSDATMRPRSFNLLNPFAGHALEREDFRIGDKLPEGQTLADVVSPYDAALKRYLQAAATQATAGKLRDELGLLPNQASKALSKLFEIEPRAQGDARNFTEKAQDLVRVPADIVRSKLTAFGVKHGLVNVPVLAGLAGGIRPVGEMFRDAGRLMKMSPEEKYEFTRDAREAGVLGPQYDRKNSVVSGVSKIPIPLRAAGGALYGGYEGQKAENEADPYAPLSHRVGAGVLGSVLGAGGGAALPHIGRASNDLTWALDEAAKRAVYNGKIRQGMNPAEAAAQTLKDTIDYSHQSPAIKFLQDWGLAPFATFASKVPGAVVGSVARNPRNAVMLDRLTGGLASSGKIDLPALGPNDQGQPQSLNMSTPLSETLDGVVHPARYVRSKTADVPKAVMSAIASFASGDPANVFTGANKKALYMTYGEPLTPHRTADGTLKAGFLGNALAGYGPLGLGREAIDALNADEFSPQGILSRLLGSGFGAYIK